MAESDLSTRSRPGDCGLVDLLRLALAESGAERAYVAFRDAPEAEIGILAMACSGEVGPLPISRTVLREALLGGRSLVCVDTGADTRFASGTSVRRLALRCVISAALPARGSQNGALVLDSRLDPRAPLGFLQDLVETLAPVAGLLATRARPLPPAGDRQAPAPEELHDWIGRIAPTELPVLIHGETGSGKEQVAVHLHRRSRRAGGPLVSVNCAAFTESLLDATLFGAVRGAYTGAERDRPGLFERAAGGTLFLDELGDMPQAMQARLLRVLETRRVLPVGADRERPVDVRIVAATHRDLRLQVRREAFRADLFHRLAILEVHVPPLRERLHELPRLVDALGPRLATETGLGSPRLNAEAWDALGAHDWPGNVRELHAVLARGLLRSGGGLISAQHLGLAVRASGSSLPLEHSMILRALDGSPRNLTVAARRIGWTRQKLYRRMQVLGIARDPGQP